MNNATLGNTSLLPIMTPVTEMIPDLVSVIVQLPVSIYIVQLIISRHCVTSEFLNLKEAIFEIFICLYEILGLAATVFRNALLLEIKMFFLGFLVTGRPCLLALICMERYLAVVKPVLFLRLKPLRYKLALSGIIWLWTLAVCSARLLLSSVFHYIVAMHIFVFCVVKLYCCIACLLVLKQPGPGEGVRQREGMSSIKRKAFRIILILTVSVFIVYVPLLVALLLRCYLAKKIFDTIRNVCYTCTTFIGLIQALLILQRFGKLPSTEWP